MAARRIEITVPEETWWAVEEARGATPRATWIKDAIEFALRRDGDPRYGEVLDELEEVVGRLRAAVPHVEEA